MRSTPRSPAERRVAIALRSRFEAAELDVATDDEDRTLYRYRPAFEESIAAATPAELAEATIDVEKTNGPVLIIAGDDDELWGSCQLSQFAVDRLKNAGHSNTFADDYRCYPGAGHWIGFPGFSTLEATMYETTPSSNEFIVLGGDPAGIAHAQRDATDRMRAFLASALQ